jgi:toxin CcdB
LAGAAQFDVFRATNGLCAVVIQSDLLEAVRTRVVAPLLPVGMVQDGELPSLNPRLAVGSESLVLMPQLAATLTLAELGERVGTLVHERDRIVRAMDALLSGV